MCKKGDFSSSSPSKHIHYSLPLFLFSQRSPEKGYDVRASKIMRSFQFFISIHAWREPGEFANLALFFSVRDGTFRLVGNRQLTLNARSENPAAARASSTKSSWESWFLSSWSFSRFFLLLFSRAYSQLARSIHSHHWIQDCFIMFCLQFQNSFLV